MLQYAPRNHFQMGEMKDIYTKRSLFILRKLIPPKGMQLWGSERLSILINLRMRLEISICYIQCNTDSFCVPAFHAAMFLRLLFKGPNAVLMILFLEIWLRVDKKCETLAFTVSKLVFFFRFLFLGRGITFPAVTFWHFSLAFRK